MLFSTNRIKELRLRIDTLGLLTNQDFYIHLVEKKVPFPPSSHALRASHAPGILFLLPFERLPRRLIMTTRGRSANINPMM